MLRHKSGGYKLGREKKKKTRPLRARDVLGGGGRGGGAIYPPHQNYDPFCPPDREALHHTLTMIGGGGSEKASFQPPSLPVPRLSRILH